ncbi:hypothetical protein D088_790036 [Salmonella enterica subsp. houtenae serovar 16:z4,z32:-- str. RKS3027]|nr:hypothetical protein D088_790036 [Salmonella enterica subsp. houtenae serovar 16:z4,z32:-- str. RKS3027]
MPLRTIRVVEMAEGNGKVWYITGCDKRKFPSYTVSDTPERAD